MKGIKVFTGTVYQCRDCGEIFQTLRGVKYHRLKFCKGLKVAIVEVVNPEAF